MARCANALCLSRTAAGGRVRVLPLGCARAQIVDELATAGGRLRIAHRLKMWDSRVYTRPDAAPAVFIDAAWLRERRSKLWPTAEQLFDMVNTALPAHGGAHADEQT